MSRETFVMGRAFASFFFEMKEEYKVSHYCFAKLFGGYYLFEILHISPTAKIAKMLYKWMFIKTSAMESFFLK